MVEALGESGGSLHRCRRRLTGLGTQERTHLGDEFPA